MNNYYVVNGDKTEIIETVHTMYNLGRMNITKLVLTDCPNLVSLYWCSTQLVEAELNCPNLTSLVCSISKITIKNK